MAKPKAARYKLIDAARGISFYSMLIYHFTYDLVVFAGVALPWFFRTPGYIWQQATSWTFIIVAGASLHLGSRKIKHGLTILACGMAITMVTIVTIPSQMVVFGILHLLGTSILICNFMNKWLQRIPAWAGTAGSFASFLLLKNIPQGYVGFLHLRLIEMPSTFYGNHMVAAILGFSGNAFRSSDYFPLIPWVFLFLTGYFAWQLLCKYVKRSVYHPNWVEWTGQNTLVLYMLHQPILFATVQLYLFISNT